MSVCEILSYPMTDPPWQTPMTDPQDRPPGQTPLGLGVLAGTGSNRFQIENRNCGSTLLKNQVPASVGSGTETFKYLILKDVALVKYPIPKVRFELIAEGYYLQ